MEGDAEALEARVAEAAGGGVKHATAVVSSEIFRRVASEEYPRWALIVTSVAALGYTVSVINALIFSGLETFPARFSEVVAGVVAAYSVTQSRKHPTRAARFTLLAAWFEVQFGLLTSQEMYALGMIVTPIIIVASGLMLGSRWAFFFAIASSLLGPLLISFSPAAADIAHYRWASVEQFYVLAGIVNIGTWVVVAAGLRAFLRAFDLTVASEQRLAELIHLAPDGILTIDADARVTAINPAAERMLGVDAAAWIRQPIDALLSAAGADEADRGELLSKRDGSIPTMMSLAAANRAPVHIEVTERELQAGGEQWMLRDVSERVREEAARRAMEVQLSHVQRMEAVGQLAGGIAHDFNNLLTAIGASAEMLRQEAPAGFDSSLIDDILAAQERGSTLTRQLLSFARRDIAEPRVFDLATQVQELERLVARVAGERVRLAFAFSGDCRVCADVGQVEQALVNLVSNARDAMPEGGACRIAVAHVNAPDGTGWVSLAVTDTGVGMDEETKRRAFEPFFTTKPRGKGTGLGLASVHGIVTANGGRARVESVPGLGTTVTLEFPEARAPLAETTAPEPMRALTHEAASVLVAEDDEAIRSAVRRILTRVGYAVVAARDGHEAARIAEAREAPFDLVLTDVIMPSLTGPQLVARLRRRWPNQPALFMSGYPEDALAEVPNFSVQRDFIAKPFRPAELERRVAEAIAAARNAS